MKGRKIFFITVCFLLLRYGSLFRSLLNLNNNNNNNTIITIIIKNIIIVTIIVMTMITINNRW